MNLRLRAALSREGRLARLGPSLVLALGLFAYRSLILNAFRLPGRYDVERWFFEPDRRLTLLVIGMAAWLLWRRRARLLSLPARFAPVETGVWLALSAAFFLWAQLTGAAELLLVSLAASLLAWAGASRGRPGFRVALLPALLLLLATPIPLPLRNELVWQLQLWSARASAWVMQGIGFDVVLGGVLLQTGERIFTVIESCSGLRGIEILTLVAIAIRELFAASGRRQWLLVLFAPCLGFAINVVRVVVVVTASAEPEGPGSTGGDHTPQGLAVLLAGTVLLYALGWAMAGSSWRRTHAAPSRRPERARGEAVLPLRAAAAWLVALGAISLAVAPFPEAPKPSPALIEFPENLSGWHDEDLPVDPLFLGYLPSGQFVHRRYERQRRTERPPHVVDLFVGYEVAGSAASSRLFTSKIAAPGRDWSLGEVQPERIWMLGLDAELAVASRDSVHALVYTWRLRDGGIWWEAARSLLALDSGPLRRQRRRAVVRLSTPLSSEGPVAFDRGKQTLDLFITDFRDRLAAL